MASCRSRWSFEDGHRLLIGVGLNVQTNLDEAPVEVRAMATSLAAVSAGAIANELSPRLLAAILRHFESILGRLAVGRSRSSRPGGTSSTCCEIARCASTWALTWFWGGVAGSTPTAHFAWMTAGRRSGFSEGRCSDDRSPRIGLGASPAGRVTWRGRGKSSRRTGRYSSRSGNIGFERTTPGPSLAREPQPGLEAAGFRRR